MSEHRADDNGAPSIHDQLAQLISLTRQNGEQLCECRSLTESRWEKMTAEIEEEQRQTQGLHDKLDEITSHRNEDLQQLEPSAGTLFYRSSTRFAVEIVQLTVL